MGIYIHDTCTFVRIYMYYVGCKSMGIYMIHVHLLEYIMLGVRTYMGIYMIHVHLLEYIMLGVRVWICTMFVHRFGKPRIMKAMLQWPLR